MDPLITFKIITPPKTFSVGFFALNSRDYQTLAKGEWLEKLGCVLQFEQNGYIGPYVFDVSGTTSWYLRDLNTNVMLKPRHLQLNDIVSIEYIKHTKLFKWSLNDKLLYKFALEKSYESANEIYFWFSMFEYRRTIETNVFKYQIMYCKTN